MRGTSLFHLLGLLIGAALGNTSHESKTRKRSLVNRIRYEFFLWRMHRMGEQALKDFRAGKCRELRPEHFESLDNYLNLP